MTLTLLAGPVSGGVAVEWRGPEAPDEALRIAVREAIAGADGRPLAAVPDQALARARTAVSREHPAAIRELRATVRAGLDRADADHRAGRFDEAVRLLEQTLESLQEHPDLPGAAASAREAHLLAARVAWARGRSSDAEQALSEALRLDPEARLAARQAPPELIDRYLALQLELLEAREHDWITPRLRFADGDDSSASVSVEIDGVPGLRPIPKGPHFVVVFRTGHEPVAGFVEVELEWTVPATHERISTDPDREHEAICRALAIELLVLAERRGTDVGLQGYRCGSGYGPRWSGKREGLSGAAPLLLAGPFDSSTASLADRWTQATPEPIVDDDPIGPVDRPWYRRGWVWGTSAGVAAAVVGGVVAGVVLGARRPPPSLQIDADQFIGGR